MIFNTQSSNQTSIPQQTLSLDIQQQDPLFCKAVVIIPQQLVNALFTQATISQQQQTQTLGFNKGQAPIEYVSQFYKSNIIEHIKEFLFKYIVTSFLFEEIQKRKIILVNEPRLIDVQIELDKDSKFIFEFSLFPEITIHEWKYLPFKAPKRKNYKDLDRQVEIFIEDEKNLQKNNVSSAAEPGDWVNFELTLVDKNGVPLLGKYKTNLWLRIGNEEVDSIFHDLLLNKSCGDQFVSSNKALQHYFSSHLNTNYNFQVTIIDILKNSYFCIEQFKKYFKLKSNKDLYQKIIEVFSYRNDISLRRSMIEESLKLLLSKHKFIIPNYLVLRQQKNIIDIIKSNPDYQVYRIQKEFNEQLRKLAEKQIRETIFLDQLSYYEDMDINHLDVRGYLNLTNRQRMKDFIYYDLPSTKINGQEMPFIAKEIERICLREKTLNNIIYHLNKK